MGRGQKRGFGGRGGGRGGGNGGGGGGGGWNDGGGGKRFKEDKPYITFDMKSNADFEEYYRTQGIIPDGEWEPFLNTLRKQLPVTFRINGSGKFADHLRDKLQTDFFAHFSDQEILVDGEPLSPPKPLPWYPNNYGWHMDFSRGQLRKMPLLEQIHGFIKRANEAGSISRQESVSMVPPLFLDVQPHHAVLDMCAAPGSKTFQLLEALHAHSKPGQEPTGLVVANDADFKRCNLLQHQTKRVCSPNLLVTNHDAQLFPILKTLDAAGQEVPLKFDRILADVPCSGDGTMRKSPDIWRRWSVQGGNSLHPLQLRIAVHGARLMQVGGRMVYSTCTFNPIEDEAVVAALLQASHGSIRLVDVSSEIPNLRRMPGMHAWKVKDTRNHWFSSWEEARATGYKLEPSMFPPSPEAAKAMHLERCMRFLPHHQDTGGFFVCVLEKVSEWRVQQPGAAATASAAANPAPDAADAAVVGAGASTDVVTECTAAASGAEAAAAAGASAEATQPVKPSGDPYTSLPPAEAIRAASSAVINAAEQALNALDKDDEAGAHQGKHQADLELRFAYKHLDRHKWELKAAARKQAAVQAAPATGRDTAAGSATAGNEAAGAAAAAGNEGAGTAAATPCQSAMDNADDAGDAKMEYGEEAGTAGQDQEAEESAEVGGSDAEDEGAAAGPRQGPVHEPSWVRGGGGRGRAKGGKWKFMDPVYPVEEAVIQQLLQVYYGLDASFPLATQLITRSLEGRPKRLYYISKSVLNVLLADKNEALKVVATGLKVFERQEVRDQGNECPYRLAQEGLPFVLPHITKQRLIVPAKFVLALLKERFLMMPPNVPLFDSVETAGDSADYRAQLEAVDKPRQSLITDTDVLAQLPLLKCGCVAALLEPQEAAALGLATGTSADDEAGGLAANAPLALVAWRGKASVAVMVDKAECSQLIDKLEAAMKPIAMPTAAAVDAPMEAAAVAAAGQDACTAAPADVATAVPQEAAGTGARADAAAMDAA